LVGADRYPGPREVEGVVNGRPAPPRRRQKAVRDALIAFMAATAQAQAEATKAAQKAGIEHAEGKD
jgi:hypothetical protein